jgi:hypothetical protein
MRLDLIGTKDWKSSWILLMKLFLLLLLNDKTPATVIATEFGWEKEKTTVLL